MLTKKGEPCPIGPERWWGTSGVPLCHVHNPDGDYALQHPGFRGRLLEALEHHHGPGFVDQGVAPAGPPRYSRDKATRKAQLLTIRNTVPCSACGAGVGAPCSLVKNQPTVWQVHRIRRVAYLKPRP